MAISQQVMSNTPNQINGELLQKVILENDVSKLNPIEKVQLVKKICESVGLNPLTKPIQIIKFPKTGKETLYFAKDATEQLRKLNNISITKIETKLDNGIYIVTAYASTPEGRQDSSTGVISIQNLKGEDLSNAMMKGETKAKRRVTLSICGLGFIDECEAESIPGVQKVDIASNLKLENNNTNNLDDDQLKLDFSHFMYEIERCGSIDELQETFKEIKKMDFSKNLELFKKLIDAKDKRKATLMTVEEFNQEYDEVKTN